MTPAQKIALEAKLSVQRINQLAAWLDHNRPVVGDSEAGLREALRTLLVRFDGLQHAIDTPPAIGFVGEPGSGKSQLVRALTALGEGRDGSRGRLADGEVLRNLLFHDGEVSCSAAVRFRSAASQGAQREHPFRIGLLGLADVAAIIVRVYCSGFPRARCTAPSLARIASIYEEVSRNLQAGSVPGFTDRDVYALRETLDTLYPDFEGLKLLTAAGYWNDLAEVAAHIPDADRLKVLSLLWGEQPELTRLFTELGETLARLGFVTEAFCPREALIELDPASGWMRRHSESIIDCASMARLGTAGAATLHVVGRYGQAATVTRAAMTALVADLSLTISSAPLAALKPAEIIAFPSHAPPDDLATLAASAADPYHDNGGGTPGAMQIARLYARAKAAHIFDRACQRNEVTTLVVCIDPVADHNDTLQPAIGDWIDIAQGADPYVREQRRSGLFVAAVASAGGALLGEAGMSADLADAVAADLSWPREWTPSRPFLDVIEVGVAARASAAGARELRGLATEPHLAGHGEDVRMIAVRGAHPAPNGANREDVSPRVTETLVRPLLDAIAPVSQTPVKQRQLRRQLGELHRRLRSRFLRFHTDGELVEWRQRIAAIIDHRLYRVVRNGKLGLLLSALMVSEAELLALYQRSLRQPFEQGMETMLGGVADIEIVEPGADGAGGFEYSSRYAKLGRAEGAALARQVVAHWHAAMRRSARSARLCRDIGIGEALLEHIIDEIGAGAARLGLTRAVAEAIVACNVHGDEGGRLFASCVGPVVNGFVESLVLSGYGDDRPAATAAVDAGVLSAETALATLATQQTTPRNSHGAPEFGLEVRWCRSLASLIEANIVAARYTHGGGANSDLGRLLSQLPVSHLEVDA